MTTASKQSSPRSWGWNVGRLADRVIILHILNSFVWWRKLLWQLANGLTNENNNYRSLRVLLRGGGLSFLFQFFCWSILVINEVDEIRICSGFSNNCKDCNLLLFLKQIGDNATEYSWVIYYFVDLRNIFRNSLLKSSFILLLNSRGKRSSS